MSSYVTNQGKISVKRLHAKIGAEVRGINLAEYLDPTTVQTIHSLWMQHLILVFPDQSITDDQHIAFGRNFGNLEEHPSRAHRSSRNTEIYRVSNVDENGDIIPKKETAWQYINLSWLWHTDSSFRRIPSKGSILHGIHTTTNGGHTRYANMYAAYEELPRDTRQLINELWVIHDHEFIIKQSEELSKKRNSGDYEALPPVRHPLVQIHPTTGQRSLFLSPHTMVGIVGMTDIAGRELLDKLIEHATNKKYVYTHVWTDDDVLMWDNRCTMHSVEPFDNVNIPRVMHRVTLVGENKPIPAG